MFAHLVEADVVGQAASADGIKQTKGSETVDITLHASSRISDRLRRRQKQRTHGVFGHVERDLDVRLGSQVVDLGGLDTRDDVNQVGRVGQVCEAECSEMQRDMILILGDLPP